MDEQDLATLNLVNIPSDLLAEPYQDVPFEGVGVDDILEGRSDVPKRAPYSPYFHGSTISLVFTGLHSNYMTGWIMKQLRLKKHRTHTGCEQLDLNRFFMLPTDVLYGIFGWLHPVDLYHLVQSTKTFRGVILNQTYRGVWKSAFRLYDDLPTCPEDVSEPQWSSLLFGPDTCDLVNIHVVHRRDMLYIVPDDPDDKLFIVWSLVPKSFRHGSTTYYTDNPALEHMEGRYARYLRKDVKAKVDEVKRFLADIDAEVPGAAENYQTFLIDTAEKCDENNISVRKANTWAQGVYVEIFCDQGRLQRESLKRCLTRLVNTGHDLRDTIAAERLVLCGLFRARRIIRVTGKVYREIKPDIESMVYRKKMKRLSWERQNVVKSYYTEYRMTLKPEQWAYVPPLHQISRDSLFSDFLSSDADPMAELSRETALARFPRLISEFMNSQIAHLASLLPEETEHVSPPMDSRARIAHATIESVYFWQLLTPEATQFVKEHEPIFPPADATAWGCNHCPEHFGKSVSLPCAKSHVKEIHNMEWPVIGKDVIAYKHQFHPQPRGYASRKPFHYALEPPCQFMCKMCPKRPVYQLWSMQDLIPHLWNKHHVPGPRQHHHWEKIEITVAR
ncbi:uncharacterized protein LACBIDRAFT_291835 [Laccaria bicolor S238N-H82]|uniref:Predicted protein n=1 Tax=Laccaria bicolor (strain S238N-H82 / ATCC MYA-4686) TaxID=486041 RepID=B0CNW6_LACBS|nr:uncharacterized protein LACBIDRAFT_291835 [Laccaria bicolor S238N-H82]EDR16014.1 predicted protein [Laccaria bicolor S238N-H82]|eukprot:XP_001874222.1 predicted protein [Laccaria bicolor S238N-H82]